MPNLTKALWALAVVIGLSLTAPAVAQQGQRPMPPQPDAEAIIYRDANFQGPAVHVRAANPNLGLTWRAGSMRLINGRMRLCTLPNYNGSCVTATTSYRDLSPLGLPGNRVQSVQPVAATQPPASAVGPTLRGQSAQFYAAPERNGQRVLACPSGGSTAACARQTAEGYCRQQGWNYVGNVGMQTVGRSIYLVDVLCKRSAV